MRRIFTSLTMAMALALSLSAFSGPAQADPSGGGCQRKIAHTVNIQSCISFRASGPALYMDGYVDSLGSHSCLKIRMYGLVNGSETGLLQDLDANGPGYIQPFRYVVSSSPGQTARTRLKVYNCSNSHLFSADSHEQRFP